MPILCSQLSVSLVDLCSLVLGQPLEDNIPEILFKNLLVDDLGILFLVVLIQNDRDSCYVETVVILGLLVEFHNFVFSVLEVPGDQEEGNGNNNQYQI